MMQKAFMLTFLLGAVSMLSLAALPLWRVCGVGARLRSQQYKQLEVYSFRALELWRLRWFLHEQREQLLRDALAHGALLELRGDDVVIRCGPSAFWPRAEQRSGLLCCVLVGGQEQRFIV